MFEINGKKPLSFGTIVVYPGDTVHLAMPFGRTELRFASNGGQPGASFDNAGSWIELYNVDNPLGTAARVDLPYMGGVIHVNLWVATMTPNAWRQITYSVTQ